VIQVAKNLWRGPRPRDLLPLKEAGIKVVISLETGVSEIFHNDPYEFQSPEDYGIQLFHIKCSDIFPPTPEQVRKCLLLISPDIPTLIHCYSGVDRTGFICAKYRMEKEGWTDSRAEAEWINLGRHWWYAWWSPYLRARIK
jgi:protein-tyrosine phosphatase